MKKLLIFLILISFDNLNALDFEKLKTKNGIEFWFIKDKSIPIVSVSFSFRGGSLLDSENQRGISNFMTSLMDEGTRNLSSSEFKKQMKLNGMKLSFSSQKDRIDGVFQIIKSQIIPGFNLFHEAVNYPRFDKSSIERVRKQIISSIKIDESDISTLASNKFNKNFFISHNFSRNVKGTVDSLSSIKREHLINFHSTAFQKKNLLIGVAGNIEKREVIKFIDLVFGKLKDSKDLPTLKKFSSLAVGEKIYNIKTPQTSVLFGHPGIPRNSENFFGIRIANYILGGGGFQSRLYKNIREKKGLVYSVYSYLLSYENDGVIIGGFQTRNKSVYETIDHVKKEWKKIQKTGVTALELDNAKAYFNGSFTRNFTSTLSLARLLQIVQYYNLGEDYFNKREEIINSLDLRKVNQIVSNLYDTDKLFFMIVGEPEEK